MIFNSIGFAIFLAVTVILYWYFFSKNAKLQNILLLVASLFFYGWADWRFLILLVGTISVNFFLGMKLSIISKIKTRRALFISGILFNITTLGYFKYFNFFIEGFVSLLRISGYDILYNPLQIILPLGISFFTFQLIGYLIDIYNEEIEPCNNFLTFSTYVSFFPKLLAGPIERAQRFIPQIESKRNFDYGLAVDGMRQILWGLFKKVVIADNCASIVNPIFNNYTDNSGGVLLAGLFFYIIQVYADFSGYSDIAIGVSKLFGIRLMKNFAFPFYSTSISDFWKKWHISLSSWMMDYVFTPLSFLLRRLKRWGLIFSIIITFSIVGFWHGANWTFIVFGLFNGLYFVPLVFRGTINKSSVVSSGKILPSIKEFLLMLGMFILVMLTVIFFRAESLSQSFQYLKLMTVERSIFSLNEILAFLKELKTNDITFFILFLFVIEWLQREKEHALESILINRNFIFRWLFYFLIFGTILLIGKWGNQDFIYLQF